MKKKIIFYKCKTECLDCVQIVNEAYYSDGDFYLKELASDNRYIFEEACPCTGDLLVEQIEKV